MWAWELSGGFGLSNLRRVERPDPTPGPGQIVVQMSAMSLNFRDLLMVEGMYNPKQRLPLIPLSDGVGRVVATGPGVRRVKLGDRVCPTFFQGWTSGEPTMEKLKTPLGGPLDGVAAERVLLSEEGVVVPPAHMTDAEAATLPCAALTAWTALVQNGGVRPGETVLIQGTGGVSLFALQIVKLLGARALITSSNDAKLQRALDLGADAGLNYRQEPGWAAWARAQTDGRGVDHVIEVGGAGTLEESIKATRPGGAVHLIGVLSGAKTELTLTRVFMQAIRLLGVLVGHREAFEQMNRAFAQAKLRPVLDRDYAVDTLPETLGKLSQGRSPGQDQPSGLSRGLEHPPGPGAEQLRAPGAVLDADAVEVVAGQEEAGQTGLGGPGLLHPLGVAGEVLRDAARVAKHPGELRRVALAAAELGQGGPGAADERLVIPQGGLGVNRAADDRADEVLVPLGLVGEDAGGEHRA
jgi:NADPH:quinone reductase-like Zn-dependent oxidoreductase